MSNAFPKTVLITGATGGIGGALALAYARSGVTLILQGRNVDRLASLKAECEGRGAAVRVDAFDIRAHDTLRSWLQEMDRTHPLDLVFANAGLNVNMGSDHQGEPWEYVEALLDVNVKAAMATLHAVLPAMRKRRSGQIAMISSLAAWRGLPETPSYSASKAAVKAYAEAMRDAVAADGVKINVVMPGYVHSQMAYDMPGPKPFMWSAEKAARVIQNGLARNQARISFPFPLNLGCWILAGIHPAVSGWILKRLNYGH